MGFAEQRREVFVNLSMLTFSIASEIPASNKLSALYLKNSDL